MRPWMITTIGALSGGTLGWAYWYFFGCTNGCAITSSPVNSTLYGAFMGGLLASSFKKPVASRTENPN